MAIDPTDHDVPDAVERPSAQFVADQVGNVAAAAIVAARPQRTEGIDLRAAAQGARPINQAIPGDLGCTMLNKVGMGVSHSLRGPCGIARLELQASWPLDPLSDGPAATAIADIAGWAGHRENLEIAHTIRGTAWRLPWSGCRLLLSDGWPHGQL